MSVKVKICGVTTPADAIAAVEAGADFLGLNFHPPSPRCLDVERARAIAAAVAGTRRTPLVGVFVNRPAREVAAIATAVGLDLLQFSGDEGPADVAPFAPRAIKVFRTGGDPGPEALAAWDEVWALLFDAPHAALYGGTGTGWSYREVSGIAARHRVFVAGGLGPGNAARAAAESGAWAIDVCSRVESAPGVKDPELLKRLFYEVRSTEAHDGDPTHPS